MALDHGASALGLVSWMPSGPGVIEEAAIARIASTVGDRADTFLLTSEQRVDAIVRQHGRCGTSTVQIVDRLPNGAQALLRRELPGVRLVQVVHVTGEAAVEEALEVSENVDALLLDSGNPNLSTKELGGTGRVHDWSLSRRIVEQAVVPVWLAGGLNPRNVDEAIRAVGPFGLDICSGLRVDGALDPGLLGSFMQPVSTC